MAIFKIEDAQFNEKEEIVYVTISSTTFEDKKKMVLNMDMNAFDFFTYAGVTGRLKRDGKRKDDPILGDYIEEMVEDTHIDELEKE